MKRKYLWFSSFCLLLYMILLYELWRLCQFGGVRRRLIVMIVAGVLFVISFLLWVVWYRAARQSVDWVKPPKWIFLGKLIIVILATAMAGGGIFYAAIPYNGKLSWKIDDLLHQKKVQLEHKNLFADGVQGILTDLDRVFSLPEVLYTSNTMTISFTGDGEITQMYAFLYGKDADGETHTYLVDYEAAKSDKMSVHMDGYSSATYAKEQSLQPLLTIVSQIDWQEEPLSKDTVYQITYGGRQSFTYVDKENLHYMAGDADGDGVDNGEVNVNLLDNGGAIEAYGVTLQSKNAESPVLTEYIMEPVYISSAQQSAEAEASFIEDAQTESDTWSVDNSDGTMYYFLNAQTGWRLVVMDAAAGSRFYGLEATTDGGVNWKKINEDPFFGNIGVTEGLLFYDEYFGVGGLTGASGDYSSLYLTRDGGQSFTQLALPMDQVTELPALAKELDYTLADYDYMEMPEKNGDRLTITVTSAAGEHDGLVFISDDQGETWQFDHVKEE